MPSLRATLAAAAAILASTAAHAAVITYGVTPPGPPLLVSLQKTNFSTAVSVPLFDSTLGTLTGVSFTLAGTVRSAVGIENHGRATTTITVTSQASLTLTRPDSSTLVVTIPDERQRPCVVLGGEWRLDPASCDGCRPVHRAGWRQYHHVNLDPGFGRCRGGLHLRRRPSPASGQRSGTGIACAAWPWPAQHPAVPTPPPLTQSRIPAAT